MTWARKGQGEKQKLITKAYTGIGQEIGATVIGAGKAWEAFMRRHKTPVLHDKDGSHPTLAGSYLAACAVFAGLFAGAVDEVGVKVEGLSEGEMKMIQDVVAAEVM